MSAAQRYEWRIGSSCGRFMAAAARHERLRSAFKADARTLAGRELDALRTPLLQMRRNATARDHAVPKSKAPPASAAGSYTARSERLAYVSSAEGGAEGSEGWESASDLSWHLLSRNAGQVRASLATEVSGTAFCLRDWLYTVFVVSGML